MSVVERGVGLGMSAVPTKNSLRIADGISFTEWRAIGSKLQRMHESSQWWIGDWLAYGERYRRDYASAMQLLDLELSALKNYAWVAAKVSTRVDLSWSHHRAVAALDPTDQERWLDEALRQSWSTRELEDAIARSRSPRIASAPSLTVRAQDELYELCNNEAARLDMEPAVWATRGLAWLAENGSPHLEEFVS